ncbi:alpha/beta fold hydrolase [Streptomyces sp. NPDC050560]|uniref:alpha/beta fold hydrolase n=1 Tax=Streptomyces sp. NPDC050560 TaxID=3365630 RepID=UPI0037B801EB
MAVARVGPVRLAYDDMGPRTGTPLVFVHGWTADRHRWDRQADRFARRRRVIRLDLRGHGESGPGPGYRIRDLAGDVLGLLDGLGVERCVPVGHSMGAMVTQLLALEHPGRVERMVLVSATGRLVSDTARGLGMSAARLLPHGVFVGLHLRRAFGPGFPRARVRSYAAASAATPRDTVMACYDAMRAFDILDRAGEIRVPTLMLHGRHDIQLPAAQMLGLAARYQDALVRIVDAGHELPVEAPDAVTVAIGDFLTRDRQRPAPGAGRTPALY